MSALVQRWTAVDDGAGTTAMLREAANRGWRLLIARTENRHDDVEGWLYLFDATDARGEATATE